MEQLLSAPVFALPQAAKQALLLARLNALTAHHRAHCTAYDNVLQAFGWTAAATDYDALPYLAARLFKLAQWQSVPQSEVFKVLTSSGTTACVIAEGISISVRSCPRLTASVKV